jgi:hypothetical protein
MPSSFATAMSALQKNIHHTENKCNHLLDKYLSTMYI